VAEVKDARIAQVIDASQLAVVAIVINDYSKKLYFPHSLHPDDLLFF